MRGMRFKTARNILKEQIELGALPGACLEVGDRNGTIERYVLGSRTLVPEETPLREDTVFDMASCTKMMATAPVAFHLIEQGKLCLRDRMDRFFTGLRPDAAAITIWNLLTHTSGIRPVTSIVGSARENVGRDILDICKERDIFVMVDETYIEFVDRREETEGIPLTDYYNNLFIIRGVSKFFASPGLRLGYAVTGNHDLIREIFKRMNPWTINSLAEEAGKKMFSDTRYIKETVELIRSERKFMTDELRSLSPKLKVYEPYANFVLFRIDSETVNADTLFEACIKEKMMIRNCCTFPFLDNRYVRVCFMKHEDNMRLINCIKKHLL